MNRTDKLLWAFVGAAAVLGILLLLMAAVLIRMA